jgi:hypothetical protein
VQKHVTEKYNSLKEIHRPWNGSYDAAVLTDAFYLGMHLLLRLELTSLIGLFNNIYGRKIINAILPVIVPEYR